MITALAAFLITATAQPNTQVAADSTNTFGIRLLQEMDVTRSRASSIVASPFSADVAFAALMTGLQGQSRMQLASALGLGNVSASEIDQSFQDLGSSVRTTGGGQFSTANSFWMAPHNDWPEKYQEEIEQFFNCEIVPVDDWGNTAVNQINGWIEDHTKGEIKKLLDHLPDDSEFVLVNAAFFSAGWAHRTSMTSFDFTPEGKASTNVKGMFVQAQLPYVASAQWEAVELPYEGGRYGFVIAVPKTESISTALAGLRGSGWRDLLGSMRTNLGRVTWPEFKLQTNIDLLPILTKLGATRLLTATTDFKPILGRAGYLSMALQRAMIDVNKDGTKAAAATAIVGSPGLGPGRPVEFQGFTLKANKPFLFAIVDHESTAALFMGIYAGQ